MCKFEILLQALEFFDQQYLSRPTQFSAEDIDWPDWQKFVHVMLPSTLPSCFHVLDTSYFSTSSSLPFSSFSCLCFPGIFSVLHAQFELSLPLRTYRSGLALWAPILVPCFIITIIAISMLATVIAIDMTAFDFRMDFSNAFDMMTSGLDHIDAASWARLCNMVS